MKKYLSIIAIALISFSVLAQNGKPEIDSQWSGRTIAFMGDSITDEGQIEPRNNTYWKLLEDILGINAVSYAVNGRQMNDLIRQGGDLLRDRGQKFDAMVIMLGTNDFNGSIPMGEFFTYERKVTNRNGSEVELLHREPVIADSTFCGRANKALQWLKTTFPDKQIILLTPLHRGYARFGRKNIQPDENYANKVGLFIDDYVAAVKRAGEIWSVPVIDMFSLSGLQPEIEPQNRYFRDIRTDLLHPNTSGHIRMAYTLAAQLCALPPCFPKYIALSFDDGLNTTNSDALMDVLEQYGAKASFFVEGRFLTKKTLPQLQRAVTMGIDIENHSYDHPAMGSLTEDQIKEQIEKTDALIQKYTGTTPQFFRPPYIDHNELMHKTIDKTFICGYSCQDWDENVSAQQRIDMILANAKDGLILLLHDHEGKGVLTVEALKTVIPELQAQGYRFVTIPDLFRLRGITPAPHSGLIYDCVY